MTKDTKSPRVEHRNSQEKLMLAFWKEQFTIESQLVDSRIKTCIIFIFFQPWQNKQVYKRQKFI